MFHLIRQKVIKHLKFLISFIITTLDQSMLEDEQLGMQGILCCDLYYGSVSVLNMSTYHRSL